MRVPYSRSLQARFLIINIPLVFIAVIVAFGVFEYTEFRKAQKQLVREQQGIMESQAIILAEPVALGNDVQVILNLATILAIDSRIVGARVTNEAGDIIATAGIDIEKGDPVYLEEQTIRFASGADFRAVGTLSTVASDQPLQDAFWHRVQIASLFSIIVAAAILLGTQYAFRVAIMSPLRRLFESMENTVGEGRPAPIHAEADDEIGLLIDSFNRMQTRQGKYEREISDARASLELRVIERTRDLIRARDDAEKANRAKTRFLATMTHELRTPMNTIIGFAGLINEQPYGKLGDDRYQDHARDIQESGEGLLALINDILDMSRVEAGSLELKKQSLSLREAIEAECRALEPFATESGIDISIEEPGDIPVLNGDVARLRQVFANLVSNAIKYNRKGGQVWIETAMVSGNLQVRVRDNGIGIAPENMKQILEPFTQIDGDLSRLHGGTGLGLPLSRGLVELHGGSLEIDSHLKKGTIVTITLPPTCFAEHASGRTSSAGQALPGQ